MVAALLIPFAIKVNVDGGFHPQENRDTEFGKAEISEVLEAGNITKYPTSNNQGEAPYSLQSEYISLVNYSDVLIVRNNNSAISMEIADYFQNLRNISNINVCNISTSTGETVNRMIFETEIRATVQDCIINNGLLGTINFIVTTKGVPLRVSEANTADDNWNDPSTIDRASVDSELALILGPYSPLIGATSFFNNPYFNDFVDFSYSSYGFFLVSRFTGHNATQAKELVDKVPYAVGKKGTFVFDVDPGRDGGAYQVGNDWMRAANTILTARGFDVILDETNTFLTNNENVSGYTSWGSNDGNYSAGANSNYGFETDANSDKIPDDWFIESDLGNDQIERNDTDKRWGDWSVRINRTSANANYSAISQNVTIKPDTRYYLRGQVNLSAVDAGKGAHLRIRAYNDTNQLVWEKNGSARNGTTSEWRGLSQIIYEPIENVAKITVSAILSESNGTAYFDDIRLVEIKPHNSWLPGALAETYVSTGGRTFNYAANYGQSLVSDLILDGVTGVKGYVYEPYLTACAHPDILFDAYTRGYYLAESYYMASALKGWMGTVVGDPKLAPYRQSIVPDLAISPDDISFSIDPPTTEDIVDIYVNVHNNGNYSAMDVEVHYYDGNPMSGGTFLGSSILDVAPQSQNQTSYSWDTTGFSGTYDIYVFVDAIDRIYEKDESNNIALVQIVVLEKGTSIPELSNPLATPNPQENGGYVNITVNVTDDIWVDRVWVNITFPNSTVVNISMNQGGGDKWYNNATYWDLGDYTYKIWAKDNINNWNYIGPGVFTIQDTDGPWLSNLNATPDPQQSGGNVNLTVNVTDDVEVGKVWANISIPDGTWANVSMIQGVGNEWYYNATYVYPGDYTYTVWANDTLGNWGSASDTFAIQDLIPPSITNVTENPNPQQAGKYTNITANVTDNVEVGEVSIDIISVGNFSMSFDSATGLYFYNASYSIPNTYSYSIWARDISDNWNSSSSSFQIVDIQAPMINDVAEDPDPQELGGYVNITVNITDNVKVYEVWINITGIGNFSMSYDSSTGLYFRNAAYFLINTYTYTVWTNDTSDNWNSTSSSFQIIDTQPPTITDVIEYPDPQEVNRRINITARVMDIGGVGEVWINIIGVGNFSMIYDSFTGKYFYNNSFSVADTYTIWAEDSSGNWNSASSSFTIQDTIPPVSQPGTDMNVTEDSEVTFNGSASHDNSGSISNYTWIITKDGQKYDTLYGESPSFTFDDPGVYMVTLIVFDGVGLFHADSINAIVEEVEPPDGKAPEDFWWITVIVVIAIVFVTILLILYWKKKKKPEAEHTSSDTPKQD